MCYETMCLCSGFYVKIMACLAALNDLWSVVKLHFINWLFLWLVAAKLPCCWGFFQGNLKSKSTYTDLTRADPSAVTEAVEPKQARMKGPQGHLLPSLPPGMACVHKQKSDCVLWLAEGKRDLEKCVWSCLLCGERSGKLRGAWICCFCSHYNMKKDRVHAWSLCRKCFTSVITSSIFIPIANLIERGLS